MIRAIVIASFMFGGCQMNAGEEDEELPHVITCGDGNREGDEKCDGTDFGTFVCRDTGSKDGLSCEEECTNIVLTDGCSQLCTPLCDDYECGPDPRCGASCGECLEAWCVSGQCTGPDPEGPGIFSVDTSRVDLTPGDQMTITARVEDRQGEETLSGFVEDAETQVVFASFTRIAGEDFECVLSWTQINAVQPIEAPAAGETAVLRARFVDPQGHVDIEEFSLLLHCDDDAEGICAGACLNLQSHDFHCGECGIECAASQVCVDGICSTP